MKSHRLLATASNLPQQPTAEVILPQQQPTAGVIGSETFDVEEAIDVKEAAARAGISRTLLYEALSPELAARRGWPVLPSILLGRCRRIRPRTFRAWLAALENRGA